MIKWIRETWVKTGNRTHNIWETCTPHTEKKVKVAQSCPTLCNRTDCIQFMEISRPEHWSR